LLRAHHPQPLIKLPISIKHGFSKSLIPDSTNQKVCKLFLRVFDSRVLEGRGGEGRGDF